jgi:hypothetical protein
MFVPFPFREMDRTISLGLPLLQRALAREVCIGYFTGPWPMKSVLATSLGSMSAFAPVISAFQHVSFSAFDLVISAFCFPSFCFSLGFFPQMNHGRLSTEFRDRTKGYGADVILGQTETLKR